MKKQIHKWSTAETNNEVINGRIPAVNKGGGGVQLRRWQRGRDEGTELL